MTRAFTRPIRDLHVFDFKPETASIRYGVVVLIALVNALLRSSRPIFSMEFEFPWSIFLYSLLFTFVICSSSWVATSLLKKSLFEAGELSPSSAMRFIAVNLVVALVIYTGLYLIINGEIYPRHYALYFLLTIAVVSIENLIYLLYCTLQFTKKSRPHAEKRYSDLIVPTGPKQIVLAQNEVELIQLKDGLILIHTKDRTITSQFGSMEELERSLSPAQFFRANRQVIINRLIIKEIKKGENRKLNLLVNEYMPCQEISVSRYKRKELLDWVQS